MKYYKQLFKVKSIPANESIVYSYLISRALHAEGLFTDEGKFLYDLTIDTIKENVQKVGDECLIFTIPSISSISRATNLPRVTVRKAVEDLKDRDIITPPYLMIPIEIVTGGFFEIPEETKLRGKQLLFYGLLKDGAKHYGNPLTTWTSTLAKLASTTETNINSLISILAKDGYIKTELVKSTYDGKMRRIIHVLK